MSTSRGLPDRPSSPIWGKKTKGAEPYEEIAGEFDGPPGSRRVGDAIAGKGPRGEPGRGAASTFPQAPSEKNLMSLRRSSFEGASAGRPIKAAP